MGVADWLFGRTRAASIPETVALDGPEIIEHGTDPKLYDTDGGGEGDGSEVASGGDPLDPSDDAP